MGLTTRKNEPFSTVSKNSTVQGDNIVFIKGGSTIIEGNWLQFNDLRIDVKALIDAFIKSRARRVFNVKNGIFYVLITLNKDNKLEVVPSLSLNQTVTGNVKSFESLSNKLPLILVKLEQDGSDDLSSIKPIIGSSYEMFKGYGNFTLYGNQGETGPQGDTGLIGLIGLPGITGLIGIQGLKGYIGLQGFTGPIGDSGSLGDPGTSIKRYVHDRPIDPIANFVGISLEGDAPLSVQFTNLSVGSWDSLLWNFGDGGFSIEENPIYTYLDAGIYTVILYLYSIDYESCKIKYDYVSVASGYATVQDSTYDTEGIWVAEVTGADIIQNSVF
jgi:hypothetical protein